MKTQSYTSTYSFRRKSEKYWLKNESINSLFWEFTKNKKSSSTPKWMGNIFQNHTLSCSALISDACYLFLSMGLPTATIHLAKYLVRKKTKLKGIFGPTAEVESFLKEWEKLNPNIHTSFDKSFYIFESLNKRCFPADHTSLITATDKEWPRVSLWAKAFAAESSPKLDPYKSVQLAKDMLKKGCLYLCKDKKGKTKGMGGFGRHTPNSLVINMIYVNPDDRGKGIGEALVRNMIDSVRMHGYRRCLLFSDYLKSDNLYRKMGLKEIGILIEKSIS